MSGMGIPLPHPGHAQGDSFLECATPENGMQAAKLFHEACTPEKVAADIPFSGD